MNAINFFPLTIEDIGIYEKIFGTNIYTLKEKTVLTKPKAVVNNCIDITQELKDKHQDIDPCDYIMYVQGQIFLVAITKTIKLNIIQEITEREITILNKAFGNTFRVYNP